MSNEQTSPALAGQVDRQVRALSPWFDGKVRPARRGWYKVQDDGMRCGCCWFYAHWDGREWHTESLQFPGARKWLPKVRRWRGLRHAL